ncbi:mCG145816, partial [Mus musculus]
SIGTLALRNVQTDTFGKEGNRPKATMRRYSQSKTTYCPAPLSLTVLEALTHPIPDLLLNVLLASGNDFLSQISDHTFVNQKYRISL